MSEWQLEVQTGGRTPPDGIGWAATDIAPYVSICWSSKTGNLVFLLSPDEAKALSFELRRAAHEAEKR